MRWAVFFLIVSSAAYGQKIIEGKIVDAETGKPISFASVGIVGTSRGTSSNLNGEFTLSVNQSFSLKITCIGYESVEINGAVGNQFIQMKPIATLLHGVVVFNKPVKPERIVRRAFGSIHRNYCQEPFLQKFFYRHYCKDDSAYGRLIEAFVDVWKNEGYRSVQRSAGEKEQIRVTQLRRSLDRTAFAQGHEPISIGNILQADVVGYQQATRRDYISFYSDVNDLKTDIENYTFIFEGITTYDGQEVYEISYRCKEDSALTTSGKYLRLAKDSGMLFITTDSYAFVRVEDVKQFGENTIRTSAYYRRHNNRYYTYHLVREGESLLGDNHAHSFHIDLTSVETQTDLSEKFVGHLPEKEELQLIKYDSGFWNGNTVLKTTPLENKIINDLGDGLSLNNQFLLFRQYELNTTDGGKNGNEKFSWLREYSKGKSVLYLFFWSSDCKGYLADLEFAKRLQKKYRGKIKFVLLSLDEDETQWQQTISKYALFSDGIINYRIGKNSPVKKSLEVQDAPAFLLVLRNGELIKATRRPSDPALEDDFRNLPDKTR